MCRAVIASVFSISMLAVASWPSSTSAQAPAKEIAAVEAADERRISAARSGDLETARSLIAPEFVFVHTTGDVDDLKAFEAFTSRAGGAGAAPQLIGPPVYRVSGDLVIRTRLTASPPRPNLPNAQFRSLDVFTHRGGRWLWLAHQGAMVQPPWRVVSADAALLTEYAGIYVAGPGETRSYEVREGKLVQLRTGASAADVGLVPLSDTAFAVDGSGTTHTFLRDRTGRIALVQIIGPFGLATYRRQ